MKRFLLLLVSGLLATTAGLRAQPDLATTAKSVNMGATVVSDFSLPSATGQMVSLQAFRGSRAIVVLFTSNHCSYAEKYRGRINAMYQQFAAQGVTFLAVNSNDPSLNQEDGLQVMRVSSPYPFPYLKDENQEIAKRFNASKNPEVFVLRPNAAGNNFLISYRGKIDDNPLDETMVRENYLSDVLQQIIAGANPTIVPNMATGCNIRWQ